MSQNQTDVFVYALYLLGGDEKDVDVEEVFVKCWELAPIKFKWRTREWCDYKKISKALQSCEANTHIGMILKRNKYYRRLSPKGILWVKTNESSLIKTYKESKIIPNKGGKLDNDYRRFKQHTLWTRWINGNRENWNVGDFGSLLGRYPGSTSDQWKSGLQDCKNVGETFFDKEMLDLLNWAEEELIRLGCIS